QKRVPPPLLIRSMQNGGHLFRFMERNETMERIRVGPNPFVLPLLGKATLPKRLVKHNPPLTAFWTAARATGGPTSQLSAEAEPVVILEGVNGSGQARATAMTAPTTDTTKPVVIYPEDDGAPMAENTRQFEWIVTIKGNVDA